MIKLLLCVLLLIIAGSVYCCCRMASIYDREMEELERMK